MTVKDSGGSTISSYQYDGLGRRISETKSGTTTDLYVSSADQVLEERVGGAATAQYVWSPVYVDALVLRDRDTDANGSLDERRWVQQDANWNVTALLDNSGAVVERYAYDPYGNFTIYDASWTSRSSSSYAWLYQHQGLRYDGGAGLYHARARDLSPSLGRWLQNDPAGFGAGDVDLYRAYGNGPTGALDPGGMSWLGRRYNDFRRGYSDLRRGVQELPDATVRAGGVIGRSVNNIANGNLNRDFVRGVHMILNDPVTNVPKVIQNGVQIVTEPPRTLGEGLATGDGRKIVVGGANTGLMWFGLRQFARSLKPTALPQLPRLPLQKRVRQNRRHRQPVRRRKP